MKRLLFCISLFFSLLLFVGCQEKMIIESNNTVTEPEIFHYKGTEQASAITVDKDGLLYTATFIETKTQTSATSKDEEAWEEDTQRFCVYDLEGTCIQQVDVLMANASISGMEIKDNILYAVAKRLGKGQVLYAIDLATWEATEVTVIATEEEEEFQRIYDMLCIGDFLYILGQTLAIEQYVQGSIDDNKILGRISLTEENASIEVLDVDFPRNILLTKENTLLIYHYHEEDGYGFLEYTPQEETFEKVGWNTTYGTIEKFCLCEEGYLFINRKMLYYGTLDGMEAQIGTDTSSIIGKKMIYQKGYVFYYDYKEMMVERVTITGAIKENKPIRLLINNVDTVYMNGLGYRMLQEEVDRDTFSLKVLAQDTNFDLYLLGSQHSNAYNLKKMVHFIL